MTIGWFSTGVEASALAESRVPAMKRPARESMAAPEDSLNPPAKPVAHALLQPAMQCIVEQMPMRRFIVIELRNRPNSPPMNKSFSADTST